MPTRVKSIIVHLSHPDVEGTTWCNIKVFKHTTIVDGDLVEGQQMCGMCAAQRDGYAKKTKNLAKRPKNVSTPALMAPPPPTATKKTTVQAQTPPPSTAKKQSTIRDLLDKATHGVVPPSEVVSERGARRNCSTVAREMILAGATNEAVWAVIQKEFNLDDSKRSYPAWYRSDLRRKGLLTE